MAIDRKAYLDAVDIVCGECYGTEDTCVVCPVRICCDRIKKPKKQIIPCDVAIKRFYRVYVKVDEGAGRDEVEAAAKCMIVNSCDPDTELVPDPDIFSEIEEHDICWVNPDFDGAQPDEEEFES